MGADGGTNVVGSCHVVAFFCQHFVEFFGVFGAVGVDGVELVTLVLRVFFQSIQQPAESFGSAQTFARNFQHTLTVQGDDRFQACQRTDGRSGFAEASALLQIFQSVHSRENLAAALQFLQNLHHQA